MPTYYIEATERFFVTTSYEVKADSPEEAVAKCKSGSAAYHDSETHDGSEEWVDTESVTDADGNSYEEYDDGTFRKAVDEAEQFDQDAHDAD